MEKSRLDTVVSSRTYFKLTFWIFILTNTKQKSSSKRVNSSFSKLTATKVFKEIIY